MSNEVYINNTGKFLPNSSISNDEMEEYLGQIHRLPSKSKGIVLRNNGIKSRYYAMDKNGLATHTNAQMAALAIRSMFANDTGKLKTIDLLSCSTSTPDQLMPSHGVMVHGWLPETHPMEVVSPAGNCCSGMHAMKYAWMAVKTGLARNAISTGSERLSRIMRSEAFEEEANRLAEMEADPYINFEKEFLRWMLSDGAGAALLSPEKRTDGISLRIDSLEGLSFAQELEPCMYMAAEKLPGGILKSYKDYTPEEIMNQSILSIKQDVKLLSQYVVPLGIKPVPAYLKRNGLSAEDIDYFLPHISSEFFRNKIAVEFEKYGIDIPQEKWCINLSSVGNVGAASIYMMLDELFHSGRLKPGEKLFVLIPESARFSYVYGLMTVC